MLGVRRLNVIERIRPWQSAVSCVPRYMACKTLRAEIAIRCSFMNGTETPMPIDRASLAAEHTDLARMVDELRRAVDDDEPDFERLAHARWRLGFLLAVHLAKEDKHVYPALKRHENASLASLATKYETEMGDIDQRYRDYLADWPIQMITKRWLQFRLATTDLMDKLVQRIKREERELYPLLDR